MFGWGGNDVRQAAALFKETMPEWQGRYVYPLRRGEDPVLLTEAQRDSLTQLYAAHLKRAMWLVMHVAMLGILAIAAFAYILDLEAHLWMVLPLVVLVLIPTLAIRSRLRRTVEEFGVLPTIPPEQYSILRQRRLRETPWATLLLPALLVPFLAWRLHPHMPPSEADDWIQAVLILGLAGLVVWAVARKVLAGRAAER